MSEQSFQVAFETAAGHLRNGRVELAYPLTLKLLEIRPLPPAIVKLRDQLIEVFMKTGFDALGRNQTDAAFNAFSRCEKLDPSSAVHPNNIGIVHAELGQFDKAAECFNRVLERNPDDLETLSNLGSALLQSQQINLAIDAFKRALRIDPGQPTLLMNLGSALLADNQFEAALEVFTRVTRIIPDNTDVWFNRAIAFEKLNRFQEALGDYERSLALDPGKPDAHFNRGRLEFILKNFDGAIDSFSRALRLQPQLCAAWRSLGIAHYAKKQLDPAADCFRRAIRIDPSNPEDFSNLANALKDQGLIEEALVQYQNAVNLDKNRADLFSNLILALEVDPRSSLEQGQAQRALWVQRHALGLKKNPALFPAQTPEKLRVGFVSPDLRLHPVGRFMIPLLANLDRSKFFVACYSDSRIKDGVSRQIQSHSDLWVESYSLSYEELDRRIRDDGIHILIDLAAHTAGNRLLVFARKPAPVQITWLAYCGSTGLDVMDYRFSDWHMDPPGRFESYFSEKTLRLPSTYWCYPAPDLEIEVSPLGAKTRGFITFGCLNYFGKISPQARDCWIEIMKRTPGSKLKALAAEGSFRSKFIGEFSSRGVDGGRIEFVSHQSLEQYFSAYHDIDIALDPFPFNGGTTSCDALWMGVALVTMAGDRPVGRAGLSILSNLGLTELVCGDATEYIERSVQLANDLPRLESLRQTLRQRMLASPLMDAAKFGRDFSALLQEAWKLKGGK